MGIYSADQIELFHFRFLEILPRVHDVEEGAVEAGGDDAVEVGVLPAVEDVVPFS